MLFDQLQDQRTWNALIKRLKSVAPMLHINCEDRNINTRIRVSPEARKDLSAFNAIREGGWELL